MRAGAPLAGVLNGPERCPINQDPRGYDVTVACQLPKLDVRVRFPLPAPISSANPRSPRNRSKPRPAALVAPGPLRAVTGALPGVRKKRVSLAAEPDGGRKLIAVIDLKTWRKIAAAPTRIRRGPKSSFAPEPCPVIGDERKTRVPALKVRE